MQIDLIDNLDRFNQLKTNWERVYLADPHAHIFVSWMWLQGWFKITPFDWFVLAARPEANSSYVAFFPLNLRYLRLGRVKLIRELRMGGKPLGGYTGFVCLPEYDERAITAFANYLQRTVGWDSCQLEHVLDPRLDVLLKSFPNRHFEVQKVASYASVYITLPDSWEQYLYDTLSTKTRQNLKRHIRQVESHPEIKRIQSENDNLENQLNAALILNQMRWGPWQQDRWNWAHQILRYCFSQDSLRLNVLWASEQPVATQVMLVDRLKKTVYSYFTGYDTRYAKLSPGTVAIGYDIQDAIENKFYNFEFLMGADDYKFTLGAKRREDAVTVTILRKNLRSSVANLSLDMARKLRERG